MECLSDTANRAKSSYAGMLALSAGMTAVAHPLTYVKVLIQVGHEPLAPQPTTTIFGKKVYRLPNFLQYAGHIRKVDGWIGLYRGLGPRIMHNLVSSAITNSVTCRFMQENVNKTEENSMQVFFRQTRDQTIAKSVGIIVSYPFHLISIRMMVTFIGRETEYSNMWRSVQEIYRDEGILGFFSGIVPHLIGEMLLLWLCSFINYGLQKYSEPYSEISEFRSYSQGVSQYIASMLTYPFHLVTNIMAVNNTCLMAGNPPLMPIYASWTDCWSQLSRQGLRNRGSTLFRRTVITL